MLFDNVKLLDCNNIFSCFTIAERMNKFVKDNFVEVISNKMIKWKNPKTHSHNFIFQIAENNMKENKCFNYETIKFIKTLSIFPEKKIYQYLLKIIV